MYVANKDTLMQQLHGECPHKSCQFRTYIKLVNGNGHEVCATHGFITSVGDPPSMGQPNRDRAIWDLPPSSISWTPAPPTLYPLELEERTTPLRQGCFRGFVAHSPVAKPPRPPTPVSPTSPVYHRPSSGRSPVLRRRAQGAPSRAQSARPQSTAPDLRQRPRR